MGAATMGDAGRVLAAGLLGVRDDIGGGEGGEFRSGGDEGGVSDSVLIGDGSGDAKTEDLDHGNTANPD